MLLRNTSYNLIGLGAPLIVAVFSIPILIEALGAERFGLLTLIWAVVSYFGLFDLGLGRALIQQLSVVLSKKEHERVGPLIGTSTLLMSCLGLFAGVLLAAAAPWGVGLIRGVSDQPEAIRAVYAMAIAMPAIVLTSGFRGVLEAQHAFGIVNMIRLPMGVFTFLGPLVVVIYAQPRLDWIAAVLAGGRLIACGVHAWFAWRVLPAGHGRVRVERSLFRPLCVSGGWLTVSNIISPFMGYVDRFLIGAIVSASAVAYYATPHELVTKLWIIPGALTAVLFPTFAAQLSRRDEETWVLFKKSVHWLFVTLLPVAVTLVLFAHEILSFWIDREFADHSAVLLQVFAAGILVNCLAHVPFTLIQSANAPKITALIHTAELPFFLAALWWLTSAYGVIGAASAWLMRMIIDTALMFAMSSSFVGQSAKSMLDTKVLGLALLGLVAFSGVLFQPISIRVVWIVVAVSIAALTLLPIGSAAQNRGAP